MNLFKEYLPIKFIPFTMTSYYNMNYLNNNNIKIWTTLKKRL